MAGVVTAGADAPERFWPGRRVLVTGATGIVGSWLVKELVSLGAEQVVALVLDADPRSEFYRSGVHRRVAIVSGALEDERGLERAVTGWETDTVLHLGAQTLVGPAHRAPLTTFEANIRGTYNLLEACRRHADLVRAVVVASSDKAYGPTPDLPYTEDMPLQGVHPYEVSKSCADLLARSYAHTYGLPVAVARCGNIYGGGDLNWSRIVPEAIRACLEGRRPVLRSDGTFVRDYLYVKDAVAAYLELARQLAARPELRGEAFNFSREEPLTVLEMVDAVRRAMGRDDLEPDIRGGARGEILDQRLSSAKAREVLGWAPRYPLEDGLRETVAWYRAFLDDVGP